MNNEMKCCSGCVWAGSGAIHVSIVDLILPETPCFPFGAFRHSGQMHFLILPVIPIECLTSCLLCLRIRNRLGIIRFQDAPPYCGTNAMIAAGATRVESCQVCAKRLHDKDVPSAIRMLSCS